MPGAGLPFQGKEITTTITINMDKKCIRCGKNGAPDNGICMKCLSKAIGRGEYDHVLKPDKP